MDTVTTATVALAVLTGILVIITGIYAYLTWQLVKAGNTPEVGIYLNDSERSVSLCVVNVGTGAARNINFLDQPYQIMEHDSIRDIEFLKSGIDYLAPNHTVHAVIFTKVLGTSMQEILESSPTTIHITYTGSRWRFKPYRSKFKLFV